MSILEIIRKRRKPPEVDRHTFDEWAACVSNGQIFGKPAHMEYSPDESQVRCHLCGNYFKEISNTHLWRHGLFDTNDYRVLLGFDRNFGLASPVNSDTRSKRSVELNSISYVEGKRISFSQDNPPLHPGYRLQRREATAKRILSRRDRNTLPPSLTSENSQTRRTHRGSIKVYGQNYFIGNTVGEVTVEVTNSEIVARGVNKQGKTIEKRFVRKDRHQSTPF